MLRAELKSLIEKQIGTIQKQSRLSGGSIHQAFVLNSDQGPWVAKVASDKTKIASLTAEKHGLELLTTTNTFCIPEIIGLFETQDETALVMRFIESIAPSINFWDDFAKQLASLHNITQGDFGFIEDNFIGALPQYNKRAETAHEFYINNRLEPQFKLAAQAGYVFNTESLYKNLEQIIPRQSPALIHGDLWNGNYLVSVEGPVLIDPAVYFGIAEMDLAMMALFGGFPKQVFDRYAEIKKLDRGWQSRIELWQLYYLLVHLNLFGNSYLSSVRNIIGKYS